MSSSFWKNKKVLITAGPTREFFDPVRFLSNPSTGKMGYALAEAALSEGAEVYLVSGPVSLTPPKTKKFISVTSARDMYQAAHSLASKMDVIIMTAAVSDYRPKKTFSHKVKKTGDGMTIEFAPNPDILASLGKKKKDCQILVGFAAETNDLKKNALKKIKNKNLDMIIVNPVGKSGTGFESETNQGFLIHRDGQITSIKKMTKVKMAEWIITQIKTSYLDRENN